MSRAQIKMFETISVLVVFFFILIFGLVWYNNSQRGEIKKILDENNQLRAMETVSIAINLPELQCSIENIQTTNCFELVKLESFRQITPQNKLYYTNLFSYANLTVRQLYPRLSSGGVWELYANKPKKVTSNQKQFVPILIYDSINRRYYAAMLTVEVYS
jgi:hypothetical protein